MKQKYSYLFVVIISMFSLRSVSCAELSKLDDSDDFTFIMQSLKAAHYDEALQGNGERRGIQKLGQKDPIFTMKDTKGDTLLHVAVQAEEDVQGTTTRNSVIDAILKKSPDLLNAQNQLGFTPFMIAIDEGRVNTMEHLLTKPKLSLTMKDSIWCSNALVWAIYHNRPVDFIQRILDKNTLLLDEYHGKKEGYRGEGEKRSLLHEAVEITIKNDKSLDIQAQNKMAIINELIKRKPALLQERDEKGRTPLELAQILKIDAPVRKTSSSEVIDDMVIATLEIAEKAFQKQQPLLPKPRERAITPRHVPLNSTSAAKGVLLPVTKQLPISPDGTTITIDTPPDTPDKSTSSTDPVLQHSTTSEVGSPDAPWYHNNMALIGIPIALGVVIYGIQKIFKAKNRLVDKYVEKQTTKAAHDD